MNTYPVAKIQLQGPAPFGGAYFSTLTDPAIDRMLATGWTIVRTWMVIGPRQTQVIA